MHLSINQHYASKICQAVSSGVMDEDLRLIEVGGLCRSKWLTLECQILRYYDSKSKQSKKLRILAENLIGIYFPCWFCIKHINR